MTIQSPAFVISADSHSAALFRQTLQTLIAGAGVSESTGLATAQHGTPNMSVDVAAGMLWMPGTLGATSGFGNNVGAQTAYGLPSGKTSQGMYAAYNDATANQPIAAADPTNPRIDLICAAIQDAQYSGVTNTPVFQVITGTPNPSPSAPAAPASSVVLSEVRVNAAASSIVNANITDKRPLLGLNGGIIRASSSTQYPANPREGDYIDDAGLDCLVRYNGANWLLAGGNLPAFAGFQGVAQTLTTNTWTSISIDNEVTDNFAGHSNVTNNSRYTVVAAGLYLAIGTVLHASNGSGDRGARFTLNGSPINLGPSVLIDANPGGGHSTGVTAFAVASLSAGDYVELQGFQSSGGNLNTLAGGAGLESAWALHYLHP